MQFTTTASHRLVTVSLFCCLSLWAPLRVHLQAADQSQPLKGTNIDPRTEEDWKALPEEIRAAYRKLWEVPLYLMNLETYEAVVHPGVWQGSFSFDEQYFKHLRLEATPDGEPRATKSGAEVDAVKASYAIGKLKVETRQSVWVWGLWIPFNDSFKAADVPGNVIALVPPLKGKVTKLTSEHGRDFYVCPTDSHDEHILLRQMVATDTGVLLWGLKGNPLTSGVVISPQMWLNKGWFRAEEIGRK